MIDTRRMKCHFGEEIRTEIIQWKIAKCDRQPYLLRVSLVTPHRLVCGRISLPIRQTSESTSNTLPKMSTQQLKAVDRQGPVCVYTSISNSRSLILWDDELETCGYAVKHCEAHLQRFFATTGLATYCAFKDCPCNTLHRMS